MALLSLLSMAGWAAPGCVRSHDRPQVDDEPDDRAEADLEQAFAEITVRVNTYEGFNDPIGTLAPTPSTQSAYVIVNGGTRAGRIPGLRVFHGDAELREVGSAGNPQQFSYQGPEQSVGQRAQQLLLRLGEASFSYPLETSSVDLSAPEKGAELASRGEFVVRWTSSEPPTSLSITPIAGSTCELAFSMETRSEDEALYAVTAPSKFGISSCRAELAARWELADEALTSTPFASFVIARQVKRTRRFLLSLFR